MGKGRLSVILPLYLKPEPGFELATLDPERIVLTTRTNPLCKGPDRYQTLSYDSGTKHTVAMGADID